MKDASPLACFTINLASLLFVIILNTLTFMLSVLLTTHIFVDSHKLHWQCVDVYLPLYIYLGVCVWQCVGVYLLCRRISTVYLPFSNRKQSYNNCSLKKENYRLVSLLPHVSKVMKKLIFTCKINYKNT